jgi:Co/Zn/Cd efflux system component
MLSTHYGKIRLQGPAMLGTSHDSTVRAILYAFLANFGIAIAKTRAAIVTGSGSMLAEAIHSYADTGNRVLLFLGLVSRAGFPASGLVHGRSRK